jgi:cytoskeletal protein CcmA (bactofilin family)
VVEMPPPSRWRAFGGWSRACGVRLLDGWDVMRRRWRVRPATGRLSHPKYDGWVPSLADGGREEAEDWEAWGRWLACPWCQAPAWVPRRALNHACFECGGHFRFEDHVIAGEVNAKVVTAGLMVVRRRGRLVSTSTRCGELVVHGEVSGAITVSGRAEFHGSGESVGQLRCGHLIVMPGARRTFHHRIFAAAADIDGELTGNICCIGRLRIPRGAVIHGNVLAGQIALDAGGTVHGTMGTLPATDTMGPATHQSETARVLLHDFGRDGSG